MDNFSLIRITSKTRCMRIPITDIAQSWRVWQHDQLGLGLMHGEIILGVISVHPWAVVTCSCRAQKNSANNRRFKTNPWGTP